MTDDRDTSKIAVLLELAPEELARLVDEVSRSIPPAPVTGGFIACTCCPVHKRTPA